MGHFLMSKYKIVFKKRYSSETVEILHHAAAAGFGSVFAGLILVSSGSKTTRKK